MAGHSKWHNIQHRKGAQDAKRGKVFTKLIKEIVVAAKMGGGVIENNPSLRAVIDKALAANMKREIQSITPLKEAQVILRVRTMRKFATRVMDWGEQP